MYMAKLTHTFANFKSLSFCFYYCYMFLSVTTVNYSSS